MLNKSIPIPLSEWKVAARPFLVNGTRLLGTARR